MSYPTSRTFPCTLAQAFPRDYAAAITHYRAPLGTVARAVVCVACCVVIGILIGASL
jgi:hypothetical protein